MLLDDEYTPRTCCFLFGGLVDAIKGSAGTIIGGVFGGPAGAAAGASLDAARADAKFARQSQYRQYELGMRGYGQRYQLQMEDMRRAGLNPILSYKLGAPGTPGVGGISSNFAGATAQGIQSNINLRMAREQITNVAADTALKSQQANAARASAELSNSAKTLNDITAILRAPEIHGTRELMDLIKEGGRGADIAAAINRLRIMLGGAGR